jgi:voltage-gated potassium channel
MSDHTQSRQPKRERVRVIKACLFDLDGTLINTTGDIATAVNETRAHLGLEALSDEVIGAAVGRGASALLKSTLPIQAYEERTEELRGVFMKAYRAHLCERTHPFEGVEEALNALASRGVKLALVTNKPDELTHPLLERLGWADRFTVIDARRPDEPAKPHPEPLLRVMRALNVAPHEVAFVGDTEVDAQAALAAGVDFFAVPYGRVSSEVYQGFYGPRARVMSWGDLLTELTPPVRRARRLIERLRLGASRVTSGLSGGLLDDEEARARLSELYKEHFLGAWDVLIVALSFYTLAVMGAQLIWPFSEHYLALFKLLDVVVCGFFLLDFTFRLALSSDRWGYLKWGWLDLLSSLPAIEAFRWGRTLRLIRLLRALHAMRALKRKLESRVQDSFALVIAFSFLTTALSAMGVLYLEAGIESANIKSAEDALWWAWVTITTVGYGDHYPVSMEGRLLAMFLMSTGVGLFSALTVQCTRYFLTEAAEEEDQQLKALHQEVQALRALILELEFKQVVDFRNEQVYKTSKSADIEKDQQ